MNKIIHWFIDNPIAANLLMLVIIAGGIKSLYTISTEIFPQTSYSSIRISASYPGAGPTEVEQQVVIRLEEAIADLEGIDQLNARAREGSGQLTIDVINGYDSQRLLNNIKSRIDALSTLPNEVENLEVEEVLPRRALMSIALYGDADEAQLKETAQWVRDELALLDSVSTVELEGARDNEMAIEISELTLRHYNLRFDDVTNAVRNSSLNLPAGTIRSEAGNIQVQTRGQAYTAEDFAATVVATNDSGAQLTLGQIANINDGFAEVDMAGNFNGSAAVYLEVFTTSPPDVLQAAKDVKAVIQRLQPQLPAGVEMSVWRDWSKVFISRMELLLKNALSGLVLVFVVLMLFLRPSLAAWVTLGIAVSFLGAFWIMPLTGVTLNMLSMFGLLLALGIVVDDAIIVGESIYTSEKRGVFGLAAAKKGVLLISKPVVFAVISTILFFLGMFGLPGNIGDIIFPIPMIVILCLLFSLVESLLILPSHLSHAQRENKQPQVTHWFERVRLTLSTGMERFAATHYRRWLQMSLKHNGQTILIFVSLFFIVASVYGLGYLKSSFHPTVPSNSIRISAILAEGAPFAEVRRIQRQIETAAYQLKTDEKIRTINGDGRFIRAIQSTARDNTVSIRVALLPAEERKINIVQTKERWQALIGPLTGVKDFDLSFTINQMSESIRFAVSVAGNDLQRLSAAVDAVKTRMLQYDNVFQVEDTFEGSRTEIELRLKPHAEVLGLTLGEIAHQVRQGFYGEEIQRIPRGRDDTKVMLRYPEQERRNSDNIGTMYIRTTDQREVPLSAVAEVVEVAGYTTIFRENRRRSVLVSAEVDENVDALAIANEIVANNTADWQSQFRGFQIAIVGGLKDRQEFMSTLLVNLLFAIGASYGLMAIAFRCLWQPLLILTAIPFGFVGAVIGHLLMGQVVSMLSMMGFLACAGVVVNDNLVLLDRIQQLRRDGETVGDAIVHAGQDRFRAILLTSLTTFVGLMPIMAETSVQAQFLIPMVVSLSFGVLFATVITLILVPNLFLLGEKITRRGE